MDLSFYIISFIVVSCHSFLNFKLCGILSDKMRFNKALIYLTCLVNGSLAPLFFTTEYVGSTTPYFMCVFVLLVELVLLYEGNAMKIIGVGIGSLIHLFVLRGISVSVISIVFKLPFSEVTQNLTYFPWLNLSAFALQLLTLTLFINLIPMGILRKVMADKSFYSPLFYFALLLTGFIIVNADIFYINFFSVRLAVHQMIISAGILMFFYIMLILLLWIYNLGIFKEKNKELEVQIEKDKILTTAVFNFAEIIIEANCTRDKLSRIVINNEEQDIGLYNCSINDFFNQNPNNHTYQDDFEKMRKISGEYLINSFNEGDVELVLEYRSRKFSDYNNQDIDSQEDNYFWHRMRVNLDKQAQTGDITAIFTIDEIDKVKREEIKLRKKAETDSLTGALNKKTFAKKVDELIADGYNGSLFMFDLDNFKGINDNMGHSKGDEVLVEVYNKISLLFREHDLVGRIGGDEYVVFLLGVQKESVAIKKACDILNSVKKTYLADNGASITITSSIGIASAPKDGEDFEVLFKAADVAMYHSKSSGKNTYTIYDKSQNNSFKKREENEYSREYDD